MRQFAGIAQQSAISTNAIEINGFSSSIILCWRVHVTWMAHGERVFVRQVFQ
jgi:hypothetical protein